MSPTITLTEEARAFFVRNHDPALQELLALGVKEFGAFMGGLPFIDTLEDPDTGREDVYVVVEVDSQYGSMMSRHHEFMCGWRDRHPGQEWRTIRFSYRYR